MKISVVIPSYNSALFIVEAVESVLHQTYPAHEVIVVDDCSSDDSVKVASSLPVRVIRQPHNGGPATARNAGIHAASGDVVAFLDADDIWLDRHLEVINEMLFRHDEADVAFTCLRTFGLVEEMSTAVTPTNTPLDLFERLLQTNCVPQTASAVRKQALLRVGGYTAGARFSEDYDLWLRLAVESRFVSSTEVTARYRVHAQQASSADIRLHEGSWKVRLDALKRLPERQARMLDLLATTWNKEMNEAWWLGRRDQIDLLLRVATENPVLKVDVSSLHQSRAVWTLWSAVRRVSQHAPAPVRDALKAAKRLLPL